MARPEAKLKELKPADLAHQVGARRDLVVTINRRSEHRLIPYGDELLYEKLPIGTRVIYAPPPLEELPDYDQAIRYALLRPENSDPLFARLNPNMRVTIAIDDIGTPIPQMRRPDVRERVLNLVLQTLADYGVDDIHLIVATALRRHMTEGEIRRMVGDKTFKQFWPDRLYNFDGENKSELVMLGKTDHNEEVWLSRRAAESDLVININLNSVPLDDGGKCVATGLCSYQSLRHIYKAEVSDGLETTSSGLHPVANRMERLIGEHLNVFAVEATLNTRTYGPTLDFLHKNEDNFNDWDRTRLKGLQWALSNMTNEFRREVTHRYSAPYGMTGVWAGDAEAARQKAQTRLFQQCAVPVSGQSDVLILGVPSAGPHAANSIMNPLLVRSTALGHLLGMHRGKPLVREGGTVIVCHPLRDEFHPEHHPSYIEFFHRCLAETADAADLEKRFETEFARNPTYMHMYRYGHAYHAVHPFHTWYWGESGNRHVGRVIAAGCEERDVAARLGWDAADTLDRAIAMATSEIGHSATITYLHAPAQVIADVE